MATFKLILNITFFFFFFFHFPAYNVFGHITQTPKKTYSESLYSFGSWRLGAKAKTGELNLYK